MPTIDEYNDVSTLELCVRKHLEKLPNGQQPDVWRISTTKNSGRALFATRDIAVNELICIDTPLLIGFSGSKVDALLCVTCHKIVNTSDICPNGCGLPVCSLNCASLDIHKRECELIRSWKLINGKTIAFGILTVLSSLRSLLLNDDDSKLLSLLQANRNQKNEQHIDLVLSQEFESFPKNDQINEILKRTTSVMNTNSFQNIISTSASGCNQAVRTLYPLLGYINHNCTPNTRRTVRSDGSNIAELYATKSIAMGEEITTTYSQILWSTSSREAFFTVTKEFICLCDRCQDATENGTNLAALKCLQRPCPGSMFPVAPISVTSTWQCNVCPKRFSYQQIFQTQSVLCSLTNTKMGSNVSGRDIVNFVETKLEKFLPLSNQLAVELKMAAIKRIGSDTDTGECGLLLFFFLTMENFIIAFLVYKLCE